MTKRCSGRPGLRDFSWDLIFVVPAISVLMLLAGETLAVPSAPGGMPVQPDAPRSGASSAEFGGGWADYSGDLGESNNQYVRVALAGAGMNVWGFDLGRESRFGETSLGYGATFTRILSGGGRYSISASSGTGEILAPRYRLGVSLSGSAAGLAVTAGYLRQVSKGRNFSDGFGLGLSRWSRSWILSASVRHDIGRPGPTHSTEFGAGLTWYRHRRIYVGVNSEFGRVSYMLLGEEDVEVNFRSEGWSLGVTGWLTSHSGLNLRLNYGETPFYQVRGATLGFFREW